MVETFTPINTKRRRHAGVTDQQWIRPEIDRLWQVNTTEHNAVIDRCRLERHQYLSTRVDAHTCRADCVF